MAHENLTGKTNAQRASTRPGMRNEVVVEMYGRLGMAAPSVGRAGRGDPMRVAMSAIDER